jgi:hypothetical protein
VAANDLLTFKAVRDTDILMADAPIILRSGTHKSRGDIIELRPNLLVMRGRHFHDRAVVYGDISDLEVSEWRGQDSVFPGSPEAILMSFTFFRVPEFIGRQKRDPRVPDSYYLSEQFAFDLTRRTEVLEIVTIIDERRRSSNPAVPAYRHTFYDRSAR